MSEVDTVLSYYLLSPAAYKTIRWGPPTPQRKKPISGSKGMTINGPPSSNDSNDITQTEELWMEDNMTSEEREERRLRVKSLLKDGVNPADQAIVEGFKAKASNYWDEFYKRNGDRFFKDRHYLHSAFPELGNEATPFTLLECGCGVGNSLIPLLEVNKNLTVIGGDFASTAVKTMREDPRYKEARTQKMGEVTGRAFSEVWDITKSPYPGSYTTNAGDSKKFGTQFSDGALLLFCLSAVPPSKFSTSISNISTCLKPGGLLLFRDYGHLDDSQLHLLPSCVKEKGRILDENTYVKQDGTICHYFSLKEVEELFIEAGFEVLELEYIQRQYANRGEGKVRRRIWCHGKFRKKASAGKTDADNDFVVVEKSATDSTKGSDPLTIVETDEEKQKCACAIA